jgi:hypothetical protein
VGGGVRHQPQAEMALARGAPALGAAPVETAPVETAPVETAPVVGDLEHRRPVLAGGQAQRDVPGLGVPQCVAQRLLRDPEHHLLLLLQRGLRYLGVDVRHHGGAVTGRAGGQVVQRAGQPGAAQAGRVDVDEQRAEPGHAVADRGRDRLQALGPAVITVRRGVLGLAGRDEGGRDQLLDHSVVQRGRDPPALGVRGGQGPFHQLLAFGPGPARPDQR